MIIGTYKNEKMFDKWLLLLPEDDNYEKPYKFYTLSKQCKLKTDLSTGKAGIGPYALNNNS